MTTEYNDWDRPESMSGIVAFLEALDDVVYGYGSLDERPAPSSENATDDRVCRLWLDPEGEEYEDAPSVLYADVNGGWFVVDLPIGTDLSVYAQSDREFTVSSGWTMRDGMTGDIDGNVTTAESVETVGNTQSAHEIDGYTITDMARPDDLTFIGHLVFEQQTEFKEGMTLGSDTFSPPVYTAEDVIIEPPPDIAPDNDAWLSADVETDDNSVTFQTTVARDTTSGSLTGTITYEINET